MYQVVVEALDRASLGEVNTARATILVEVLVIRFIIGSKNLLSLGVRHP